MAISKERKKELVAQYKDLLDRSEAVILTDYQGLNVNQITQLRTRIREANGAYYVTKNTLIQLALQEKEIEVPEDWLIGPTAIGFCFEGVPAVAKAIVDFVEESEILSIKGAWMDNQPMEEAKIKQLADLPSIDVLQAQVLGALTAPMSGLIGVLNGALANFVGVLEARRDQLGETEAEAA